MNVMSNNGYPLRDFKSAEDWHLYYVFNDKDFIAEIDFLNDKYDELAHNSGLKYPNGIPKLTVKQAKSATKEFSDLRRKYSIDEIELMYFVQGGFGSGFKGDIIADVDEAMGRVLMVDDHIEITLNKQITHKRYLELWREVQSLKKLLNAKQRRRAPESHALIYAIFKQRMNTVSFSNIFRQYSEGNLQGYSGSINQFKSEDSLERYYDKYKPLEKTDT